MITVGDTVFSPIHIFWPSLKNLELSWRLFSKQQSSVCLLQKGINNSGLGLMRQIVRQSVRDEQKGIIKTLSALWT